jgi:hypothetical protein
MTCVFEFDGLLSLTYIHTSSRVLDATDDMWYVCVQNVSQVSVLVGFVLSQTFKNLVKFIRKVEPHLKIYYSFITYQSCVIYNANFLCKVCQISLF